MLEGDGLLFPAPDACKNLITRNHVLSTKLSWSRCPAGYAVYVRSLDASLGGGARLALYGLKVVGISTAKGKSDRLSIVCKPADVERYHVEVERVFSAVREGLERFVRTNIHEIRNINTDVYNTAYELAQTLDTTGYISGPDAPKIGNIVALTETLKARVDFLDVIVNPVIRAAPGGKITVFKKFHKIVRSLKPTAQKRGIKLHFVGKSVGRIEGLKVFDVIPYLLVSNAVKYSPNGEDVYINIEETDTEISVVVSSIGPALEVNEAEKIFELGFRGKNAAKATDVGSGIGLAFLRDLVENKHGGGISVVAGQADRQIGGVPYGRINFRLGLPRAD
jgi:signal transduction histidine kinase